MCLRWHNSCIITKSASSGDSLIRCIFRLILPDFEQLPQFDLLLRIVTLPGLKPNFPARMITLSGRYFFASFLITEINYGKKEAESAENRFEKLFSQKDYRGDMPLLIAPSNLEIIDLVLVAKPDMSKSFARRLIEQGGVSLGDVACKEWDKIYAYKAGDVLKIGKHDFWRIK